MSERTKVASRHIVRSVANASEMLTNSEVIRMAYNHPLIGLRRARQVVDAFERGSREALYLALSSAYASAEKLASMPRDRAILEASLREKATKPTLLGTLRLAVRYIYQAHETGTSLYSRCCKYAHVLAEARNRKIPLEELRGYLVANGGVDKIHEERVRRGGPKPARRAAMGASKATVDLMTSYLSPNYNLGTDLVVRAPTYLSAFMAMKPGESAVLIVELVEVRGDWKIFQATGVRKKRDQAHVEAIHSVRRSSRLRLRRR